MSRGVWMCPDCYWARSLLGKIVTGQDRYWARSLLGKIVTGQEAI